ncbi:MAG TPA: hypothetical protein PKA10_20725 [Selenomonadales bacterium]|nr:hypothetical protein [Selenomonadales bacterium]
MRKFACGCGRNVRDVYYKNGEYLCGKCFWQDCESPYDYIINLLAARGLAITFKNEPVFLLRQFSADDLAEKESLVKPTADWIVLSGDNFWLNFTGRTDQLRNYLSSYTVRKKGCSTKED